MQTRAKGSLVSAGDDGALAPFGLVFPLRGRSPTLSDTKPVGLEPSQKAMARKRCSRSDRNFDGKKELRASIVFASLKPGLTKILSGRRWVWGRSVYVSALRLDDGELLDYCFS